MTTAYGPGSDPVDLTELREFRAVGRLLQKAVEPAAEFVGSDDTGTVSVTVNGRGAVQDVAIAPEWVSAVGPSELGAALLRAYQVASVEAVSASLRNFNDSLDSGDLRSEVDELAAEDTPVVERSYEDLMAGVERARRDLERAQEVLAEFERRPSVSGPAGLMRLDLDGGRIVGITVLDRRRATQVSAHHLADEARSLFLAAAPPSV